jgi:hypothetical protein
MATSFSTGRSRRESQTMGKQLVNFINIVSFVDTCIVGIDDHRETHRDNFVMLSASNKERARVAQ